MDNTFNLSGQCKNVHKPCPQAAKSKLLGLVVAGGLSSRMGTQKHEIKVHGENEPNMLDRTIMLLEKCLGEAWVSCRKNQLNTNHTCIYDDIEGLGPVGGLYASLNAIKHSEWQGILALSCDLPFMNEDTIYKLMQARAKALADNPNILMTTYMQEKTGYIEALVAIYEKSALTLFHKAMQDGTKRINVIVPARLRHDIIYDEANALPFLNINYPKDLEKARRLIKS